MDEYVNKTALWGLMFASLTACATNDRTMNARAPMPPENISVTQLTPTAVNEASPEIKMMAQHNAAKKSCSFSSFQRKNTLGYEFSESSHLAFRASPSFDIWNPDDFEMKFSLRFTSAFGGPANKRPDCTYGSGYYGLIPYATQESINIRSLTGGQSIKSFVQEKLDERERRRKEEQARQDIRL